MPGRQHAGDRLRPQRVRRDLHVSQSRHQHQAVHRQQPADLIPQRGQSFVRVPHIIGQRRQLRRDIGSLWLFQQSSRPLGADRHTLDFQSRAVLLAVFHPFDVFAQQLALLHRQVGSSLHARYLRCSGYFSHTVFSKKQFTFIPRYAMIILYRKKAKETDYA